MRYSMIKTATLALLGLSKVYLGVTAAPTAISETRGHNDKLVVRTSTVPDLTASPYLYTASLSMSLPRSPKRTYTVKKSGVQGNLDIIVIHTTENTITVDYANNAADKTTNRLGLSDIELSLFVHKGGKRVSDLAEVIFTDVSEKTAKPVIESAIKKLGGGKTTDLSITVTSTSTGDASNIFTSLQGTVFGKGLANLHTKYGIGQVTKWTITGSQSIPNLTAYTK